MDDAWQRMTVNKTQEGSLLALKHYKNYLEQELQLFLCEYEKQDAEMKVIGLNFLEAFNLIQSHKVDLLHQYQSLLQTQRQYKETQKLEENRNIDLLSDTNQLYSMKEKLYRTLREAKLQKQQQEFSLEEQYQKNLELQNKIKSLKQHKKSTQEHLVNQTLINQKFSRKESQKIHDISIIQKSKNQIRKEIDSFELLKENIVNKITDRELQILNFKQKAKYMSQKLSVFSEYKKQLQMKIDRTKNEKCLLNKEQSLISLALGQKLATLEQEQRNREKQSDHLRSQILKKQENILYIEYLKKHLNELRNNSFEMKQFLAKADEIDQNVTYVLTKKKQRLDENVPFLKKDMNLGSSFKN